MSPRSDEQLLHSVRSLIDDLPDFSPGTILEPQHLKWLGRASRDVEEILDLAAVFDFRRAERGLQSIHDPLRNSRVTLIQILLYRALAVIEGRLPQSNVDGAFIPAGNVHDAMSAVARVTDSATSSLLFVDPYADHLILSDFASTAKEGVSVHILTGESNHKATLAPAAKRWVAQHGTRRPLAIRLVEDTRLHDRMILVDARAVWSTGQSFNKFAERSPTSIHQVSGPIAEGKLEAYLQLWDKGRPLPDV